ncbi:uncharacterized protein SPSK_00596 [Sporothrix schenckii 1099-18]|uniref:Uncharacterized protein n=1 Tax=Sporothrix schenckii 1099-18 TaxID=1397361 RepID=A0A0F2LRB4_SPOSC|nr:uncharacterized protein SPSK_00596 [Sporothrix schenckii 1099-18]KJR80073.1 hypothetical protein SPSK_00596 [Sporothrix schenckii 1099-18]
MDVKETNMDVKETENGSKAASIHVRGQAGQARQTRQARYNEAGSTEVTVKWPGGNGKKKRRRGQGVTKEIEDTQRKATAVRSTGGPVEAAGQQKKEEEGSNDTLGSRTAQDKGSVGGRGRAGVSTRDPARLGRWGPQSRVEKLVLARDERAAFVDRDGGCVEGDAGAAYCRTRFGDGIGPEMNDERMQGND